MNNKLQNLESFDSGSNYRFGDKLESPNCPRSLFDLSHLVTTTIDNCGFLIPLTYWSTLPGDDFDITIDALLRVMPQVVPLYSRQRLYVYGFYSPFATLWNNWQVFMDKGYTGNVNKTVPIIQNTFNWNGNETHAYSTVRANTLFDYMGLPIGSSMTNLFGTGSTDRGAGISALPFMMYLRIYRDYFMNKNEWINDRVLLPDDDSRFRLDDDGQLLSAKDLNEHWYFQNNTNDIVTGSGFHQSGLLFHEYPDDYFMSALPFTQRGTATPLQGIFPTISGSLDYSNVNFYQNGISSSNMAPQGSGAPFGINASSTTPYEQTLRAALEAGDVNISGTGYFNIYLEDIRKLAIQQIELERLARTDGSYAQFGLSFFGERPRNAYDYRPTYIGGTYKNIAFTEVLQQAGSTVAAAQPAPSNNSPLGAYAGHGITGIDKGRIGHIHCDDYGLIMLIGCIMPDVYYSQGLDRVLTDSLQSDFYLPDRAKLGMQPIYNQEIYYAGNNGTSSGQDKYLWAYQNPFDYLRYLPNKIHGKIADSNNASFFPYTQSRKFTSLPNWGHATSAANNVRKDYLFAPSESAYSAQFSFNIRAVRPLPYKAIPAQIIN